MISKYAADNIGFNTTKPAPINLKKEKEDLCSWD